MIEIKEFKKPQKPKSLQEINDENDSFISSLLSQHAEIKNKKSGIDASESSTIMMESITNNAIEQEVGYAYNTSDILNNEKLEEIKKQDEKIIKEASTLIFDKRKR